jgi:ketosteroid isomerase-like protein
MTTHRPVIASFIVALVVALAPVAGTPFAAQPAALSPQARMVALEDREAIRIVLRDYGRLLDERRFDEFGQLFAEDGLYVAGATTRGPKAIADGLRRTFAGNSLGLAEPNFHVLFNERITLAGLKAISSSQSFFVAPGADGAPRVVMMASYEDELVKTPGGWRFAKRVVKGNMAPRPAAAQSDSAAATRALLASQADHWDKAIIAKDRTAIEANMAADFRNIDGNGTVADRQAFVRDLMDKDLRIDPYTVEDFDIRVYGDTALLSGRTRMTGSYQGKAFTSHYRYIDTYVRRDGAWQVVSVQITRIPP